MWFLDGEPPPNQPLQNGKYSDRIGRTAGAKNLDSAAIDLAVLAHIRHAETEYDRLFARGTDRHEARRMVAGLVDAVVRRWLG